MNAPELRTNNMSRVWQHLIKSADGATVRQVTDATDVPFSTVGHMFARWRTQGYLTSDGNNYSEVYQIKEGRPATFGAAEYRMWQAARGLTIFSPADIAAYSSVEGGPVSQDDAAGFCRMLLQAGYLRVREKARPGVRPARYTLIRNTGPKAPMKRRITVFIDPNTGEVILPKELS